MATGRFLLSDEILLCAICLDVVAEPVSTPCGHNFCKACIQHYWDTKDIYQCPLCSTTFSTRPRMHVNTVMSELASGLKKWAQVLEQSADGVLCDVCTVRKDVAVVSCLVCLVSLCETHLEPHQRVAGLRGHTLTAPVPGLEDRLCKDHHILPNLYCKTDQTCICGVCVKTHHKHHCVVPLEKEYESKLAEVPETMAKVQRAINARSHRIAEIKRSTKRARVFNAQLIRARPELVEVTEDRRKTAEQQATGFIKELSVEIAVLNEKRIELEHLSRSDDHHRLVLFLSGLPTLLNEEQKNTVVDFNLPDTTCVRRCATLLAKEVNLQRLKDCAVDVTLDPDTAHCNLVVSVDGKAVTLGATPQNVPDTKKRFKHHAVLSKEGFTSGKFYYEVQVKGKTSWAVGVARVSVNRKNPVSMSFGNGCWVMVLGAGHYRAYGSVSSAFTLFVKEKPQAVGVYVDYDAGQVSFYDGATGTHIYTFFGQCFNERLHPYLCTQSDRKPLTITPLRLPN